MKTVEPRGKVSRYLLKIDGAHAKDKYIQDKGFGTGALDGCWKHLLTPPRGISILQGVNVLVSQPVTRAYKLITVIRDYFILVQQQTC